MLNSVKSHRGMVTSPHHLASQAGLRVLQDGGTAAEAGVAMAAALAVVYPHMTGLGGDGFWLLADPGQPVRAVDACGRSAASLSLDLYAGLDAIPWRGPLAANTVAGTVSGWARALEVGGGTLPLARLLEDAIHHAEAGVAVTAGGAAIMAAKAGELAPISGFAAHFLPDGRPLREGETLKQPALARTLRRIAEAGAQDFYTGALARDIAADLAAAGSPVSAKDLADHRADTVDPLHARITGIDLFNMIPPTQGVASLAILALFDRLGVTEGEGFAHVHGLVEATKQAFLWRDRHCGDPAWMEETAQALLDDGARLDAMAARIDPAHALAWPQPPSAGDTVWFGAIDGEGRAASIIQSTYFEFGSGIVLPETGITWQNRGSSFRLAANGWNALAPRRKPFHTLNPALARFDDGRTMVYGTMGGEGQPQTQAAIFTRYAKFGMGLQAAITSPRWLLGRTWGEASVSLKLEDRFDPVLIAALRAAGHDVELVEPFTATTMGHAGAIVRHPTGLLEGATDPRSDGQVGAW
ncbi:gamma-glutamyltransferase family protein [Sphingomonas naphthae]|uniref:Gamma-glutamyltransferase family protein n=1 Tax=Sphingomonas naphthae TaxID=1813468 RepID=A0ABY7TKP0_9SPHN|nr:gamma-glutamyltransferase family protein [Sphingomonas naphthae]WCT73729.1 gamma-glutamyltransferase family protein [Sphingomonas naphthae]